MDVLKIIKRLFSLHKIANDQPGSPEGDNAERMKLSLMERHKVQIPEGDLVESEAFCEQDNDWNKDVASLIGQATGTDVYVIDGKIRFKGVKVAVDEAATKYKKHRDIAERLSGFTIIGYLVGVFGEEAVKPMVSSADASPTIQAGKKEAASRAEIYEREPNAEEELLLGSAARIGAEDPLNLWEGLTNER